MYKFLIQVDSDNVPLYDFGFHIIQAVKHQNLMNDAKYSYKLVKDLVDIETDYIPIGSLEFVFEYLTKIENVNIKNLKPINIPKSVVPLLNRKLLIDLGKNLDLKGEYHFIKDNTQFKGYTDITNSIPYDLLDKELIVSEEVDFSSEFRVFVYEGRILSVQRYLGDINVLPDFTYIQKVIENLSNENLPRSYSFDVGIHEGKTDFIELHPIISLGLYGFNNYNYILPMFIQGYKFYYNLVDKI